MVAYITVDKIDPVGVLLAFGLFKIFAGLYFETPIPVQTMKAIGGAAIANPNAFSPGMIRGAGLFTSAFWTGMGLTGAVNWLATSR